MGFGSGALKNTAVGSFQSDEMHVLKVGGVGNPFPISRGLELVCLKFVRVGFPGRNFREKFEGGEDSIKLCSFLRIEIHLRIVKSDAVKRGIKKSKSMNTNVPAATSGNEEKLLITNFFKFLAIIFQNFRVGSDYLVEFFEVLRASYTVVIRQDAYCSSVHIVTVCFRRRKGNNLGIEFFVNRPSGRI